MRAADALAAVLISVETDTGFTEAVLTLRDGSRLCFRHRVGERWAKAIRAVDAEGDGFAGELLAAITGFRLNAKHLDVTFNDQSHWERVGEERIEI